MARTVLVKNEKEKVGILGAGISGLIAGIILAKNNYQVEIFERRSRVGSFFKRSSHSIRNYLYDYDVIKKYRELGIEISNFYPIFSEFRYSPSLSRHIEVYSENKPLFYNFIRGYDDRRSIDNELLNLAKNYGVHVYFGQNISQSNKNINIVATGASYAGFVGYGGHYRNISNTKINSIYYFLNDYYTPGGYIYLSPFLNEFSLVIVSTRVKNKGLLKRKFNEFKKDNNIIKKIIEKSELINEIFGFSSVGNIETAIKDRKIYIGEAAGFLDAVSGFGIHYAIISGYLAAISIVKNMNYDKLWKEFFGQELKMRYLNKLTLRKINTEDQERIIENQVKKYGIKISAEDYRKTKIK